MSNKDDVRENIVELARVIFSKFGYKKTTMDDIANAAGKGKSSLYYYFKSKEEVFEAVVENEASILSAELNKVLDKDINPKEKLREYILVRLKVIETLSNIMEVIKNKYLTEIECVYGIRKKYDQDELRMLRLILEEGVEKGVFEIENEELAAEGILTFMKGLQIPLFIDNYLSKTEPRLDNILSMLFFGILSKKG
ncbi:MAG: TetR/AcrR family transcriptional regulator [Bacteroidales bacterium]|nr:TetR/AcrR family transcriptional regulator [Bacteroidales bacterium]